MTVDSGSYGQQDFNSVLVQKREKKQPEILINHESRCSAAPGIAAGGFQMVRQAWSLNA